jgi:diguanylate cyclase (GGDEF)-like protein
MEELLESQIARSRRSKEPFVVLMLDMDHFKRINDQHGHGVGDLALKHVSATLQRALRAGDSLARFGGEEFVILMSRTNLDEAQPLADRLREFVAGSPLTTEACSVPLTVSIGIAQWTHSAEDFSHLLSRADGALFQAKVQGRNRVVAAAGVVPNQSLPRPSAEYAGRQEQYRAQ